MLGAYGSTDQWCNANQTHAETTTATKISTQIQPDDPWRLR